MLASHANDIGRALKKYLARPGTLSWLVAHAGRPTPIWNALLSHSPRTMREYAPVTHASHNYNEAVIRIRAGEIKRGTVRSRIPLDYVLVEPGQASQGELEDATDFVAATVKRCAPWVTAYLTPRLRTTHSTYLVAGEWADDYTPVQLAGLATHTDKGEPVIMLSMDRALQSVRIAVHHELWHQIEAVLDEEAQKRLHACLSPYTLVPGHSNYDRSPSERLARAYSYYAMQCDDLHALGAPIPVIGEGDTRVLYDAFAEVYSGRFADALA